MAPGDAASARGQHFYLARAAPHGHKPVVPGGSRVHSQRNHEHAHQGLVQHCVQPARALASGSRGAHRRRADQDRRPARLGHGGRRAAPCPPEPPSPARVPRYRAPPADGVGLHLRWPPMGDSDGSAHAQLRRGRGGLRGERGRHREAADGGSGRGGGRGAARRGERAGLFRRRAGRRWRRWALLVRPVGRGDLHGHRRRRGVLSRVHASGDRGYRQRSLPVGRPAQGSPLGNVGVEGCRSWLRRADPADGNARGTPRRRCSGRCRRGQRRRQGSRGAGCEFGVLLAPVRAAAGPDFRGLGPGREGQQEPQGRLQVFRPWRGRPYWDGGRLSQRLGMWRGDAGGTRQLPSNLQAGVGARGVRPGDDEAPDSYECAR
mmetsp:Transcript_4143/g.17432  ORF Transcript_4143/g.17432 Transcript_4143/m.17432 type:complete len:376 (+) Transcript_4143:266-1393(+)